jgi:hypothetical protein
MPEHLLRVEPRIPLLIVKFRREDLLEFAEGGEW